MEHRLARPSSKTPTQKKKKKKLRKKQRGKEKNSKKKYREVALYIKKTAKNTRSEKANK